MTVAIKYAGRVYDVISYEAIEAIETPTSVEVLNRSEVTVREVLIKSRPGIFNVRTAVTVGFGYVPSIMVVATGEIHECVECGGQGHLPAACPYSKEKT